MNAQGAAFSALAAVLYGSSYVATAIALRSFTPIGVAAWRGVLGAAILAVILMLPAMSALRPARPTRDGLIRLGLMGLVGGAIFTVAMNAAVAIAGATVTAFVAGLYAVTAAVLAIPLLGERLERSTLLALLAALVGTILLSGLRLDAGTLAGVGIALVAAAAFGLHLVLSRRWGAMHGLTGPLIGLSTQAISGIATLLLLLTVGEQVLPPAPRVDAWVAIAWLAIGPGAAAAVLVVAGIQRLEARRASIFLLLNPPTAAVLGFVLLGERLTILQLIGGACVLAAIAAASGMTRKRPVASSPSHGTTSPPGSASRDLE